MNYLSIFREKMADKKPSYFLAYGDIGDSINMCDLGYEITGKGHSCGPAVREFYLLHLVLSGSGTFIRGGKRYLVRAGDAFLIRPMEVTTYGVEAGKSWEYCWIGFNGENAEQLVEYAFPMDKCVVKIDKQATFDFTSQIQSIAEGVLDLLAVRSTLYSLLSSARRSIVERNESKRISVVEQALAYIDANYFRSISMSELAKNIGVTRSYFTALFTQGMGCSPYNYLVKLRIEKAKILFEKNNDFNVSEVAYSVGFSSLERFSEMFKKYVGTSPLAFKKSLRKNRS